MLEKLRHLKAETLMITDQGHREALALGERSIVIPAKIGSKGQIQDDLYTPIPYIVPAQLFAGCLAEKKGLDPDRPRTLTKVTQTM